MKNLVTFPRLFFPDNVLQKCCDKKPTLYVTLLVLSETYLKRATVGKDIIVASGQLKHLAQDKFLLKSLKRCIKQPAEIMS